MWRESNLYQAKESSLDNNRPHKSLIKENEEKHKNPWLGEGFYYWDSDFDQAKWWGRSFMKNGYIIGETNVCLDKLNYLDLYGQKNDKDKLKRIIKNWQNNFELPTDLDCITTLDIFEKLKTYFNKINQDLDVVRAAFKTSVKKDFFLFAPETPRNRYIELGNDPIQVVFYNEKEHFQNYMQISKPNQRGTNFNLKS
jgi:hypothetical protein